MLERDPTPHFTNLRLATAYTHARALRSLPPPSFLSRRPTAVVLPRSRATPPPPAAFTSPESPRVPGNPIPPSFLHFHSFRLFLVKSLATIDQNVLAKVWVLISLFFSVVLEFSNRFTKKNRRGKAWVCLGWFGVGDINFNLVGWIFDYIVLWWLEVIFLHLKLWNLWGIDWEVVWVFGWCELKSNWGCSLSRCGRLSRERVNSESMQRWVLGSERVHHSVRLSIFMLYRWYLFVYVSKL